MLKEPLVLNNLENLQKVVQYWKRKKGVVAIILSGSLSYGDYREGWSDIDLTVVVRDWNDYVKYIKNAKKMHVHLLTLAQYNKEIHRKTPLSVFLSKGIWFYANSKEIFKHNLVVDTQYYKTMFLDSFVAFRLRTKPKSYVKKIRQIYHAGRYLIRGFSLKCLRVFPISEKECSDCIAELFRIVPGLSPRFRAFIVAIIKFYINCVSAKYCGKYDSLVFRDLENQFLRLFTH